MSGRLYVELVVGTLDMALKMEWKVIHKNWFV